MQNSDEPVDHAIEDFAHAAVELLRDDYHSQLEPFDVYAKRIEGDMIRQLEEYKNRLTHGYEVILRELAKSPANNNEPHQKA
jgi:hypothetical protein